MEKSCKLKEGINLRGIDLPDPMERGIGEEKVERIAHSIRKIGLINKPVLALSPEGRYGVVCGSARLLALETLGITEVGAYVIDRINPPMSDIAGIHFAENSCHRGFNLIETAYFVARMDISGAKPSEDVFEKIFELTGMENSARTVSMLKSLSGLSPFFKIRAAAKSMTLKTAYSISLMSDREQNLLARYFETANISLSKAREIISLLMEISSVKDCSIGDILSSQRLESIAESKNRDSSQKADLLRKELDMIRNPAFYQSRKNVLEMIKSIDLPFGVSFSGDPDFDTGRLRLEMSFSSDEELKGQISIVSGLSAKGLFKDVIEAI